MLMTQKQLSGYDSMKDWGSYTEADELIAGMCEWMPGAAGEWSHAHNESETEHREEMVDRRDGPGGGVTIRIHGVTPPLRI